MSKYIYLVVCIILLEIVVILFYWQGIVARRRDAVWAETGLTFTPIVSNQPTVIFTKAQDDLISTSVIDYELLQTRILETLVPENNQFGIYIKNLNTGDSLSLNEENLFLPASIYKMPLALVVLRDVEMGKTTLDSKYWVRGEDKVYDFDALSKRSGNYTMSLRDMLYYLIHYSDNTAMTALEHQFGGVYTLQARMQSELNSGEFTRRPQQAKAKDIARVLEGIYNEEYLSKDLNNYMLSLMTNTSSSQNHCLITGTPAGVKIIHKAGWLNNAFGDAGIVYTPDGDYIFVFIDRDVNSVFARKKCATVASLTYKAFTMQEL